MAEDVVTLNEILGDDPDSSDNSSTQNGVAGATTPDPQNAELDGREAGEPAGIDSIQKRLEDLERREQRHLEQLDGSKREALTWKERAEQQEKLTQQLADHLQKLLGAAGVPGGAPQEPPVPTAFKQSLSAMLGYEPDDENVKQLWTTLKPQQQEAHLNGTPETLTREEVQKLLQEDRQKQVAQQQRLQALIDAHPEFAGNEWQTFYQEVLPTYQRLQQDPQTQLWIDPDPDGRYSYNVNGTLVDLRIMDRAATLHKSQRTQAASTTRTNQQTALGGNGRQTAPSRKPSIVLPRSVIDEMLSDPTIARTLELAGKGGTKREQAKWLWDRMPEAKKKELQARYRAGQRSEVGAV